jgi:hypothetical protein
MDHNPLPTEGEIITWLSENSHDIESVYSSKDLSRLIIAALRQWGVISKPIPVEERMPDPHTTVVAHYLNSLGEPRTIFARWVPGQSRTEDGFYWEEGWYELIANWDDYGAVLVTEGQVTHWELPPPSPHKTTNSPITKEDL